MSEINIDELSARSIRILCAETVQAPNSGHPGAPLGLAAVAHTLFSEFLRFDPTDPSWINRDHFILSNGHASSLLYVMLHLSGYGITLDELKTFRSLNSRLAGHPESFHVPGVEVTTGPLGNGISSAVGMAIAQKHLASKFNKPGFPIFDSTIYVICGDGCMQEGVASEACSLAGTLGLGNLVVLYDNNKIQIDGPTSLAFNEDVKKRFEAYGWEVHEVENGDTDFRSIHDSIDQAKDHGRQEGINKPQFISVRTTIGYGSKVAGQNKAHGTPLGDAEIVRMKEQWGFDPNKKFYMPDQVEKYYQRTAHQRSQEVRKAWNDLFTRYSKQFPSEFKELNDHFLPIKPASGSPIPTFIGQPPTLPSGLLDRLPHYKQEDKAEATRKSSETVFTALSKELPTIIGGAADVLGSTLATVKGSPYIKAGDYTGRNIAFGVREHAMFAIANGIAAFNPSLIPYVSTFLVFAPYGLGAIRIAAISHLRVIYVLTHDSIGVGEDGPTHQPIETLTQLRSLPNINVIRPADGNETTGAYFAAVDGFAHPTALALSRQALPQLPGSKAINVKKGAYVIFDTASPKEGETIDGQVEQEQKWSKILTIISTGSEVHLSIAAAQLLSKSDAQLRVRVVSAPCLELFREQPAEYRSQVLGTQSGPHRQPSLILSVEAGDTISWYEFAHVTMGIDTFGVSAPDKEVYKHFGFTPEGIAEKAKKALKVFEGANVADLVKLRI